MCWRLLQRLWGSRAELSHLEPSYPAVTLNIACASYVQVQRSAPFLSARDIPKGEVMLSSLSSSESAEVGARRLTLQGGSLDAGKAILRPCSDLKVVA